MAQISARGLILDLDIYYIETRLIRVDRIIAEEDSP
jgi:hypothetical protein